jgi:hypothetical protein
VPENSGITLAQSIDRWLADAMSGKSGGDNIHVDQVTWPNNKPCAKDGVADSLE